MLYGSDIPSSPARKESIQCNNAKFNATLAIKFAEVYGKFRDYQGSVAYDDEHHTHTTLHSRKRIAYISITNVCVSICGSFVT